MVLLPADLTRKRDKRAKGLISNNSPRVRNYADYGNRKEAMKNYEELDESFMTHSTRAAQVAKKFAQFITVNNEVLEKSEAYYRRNGITDGAKFMYELRQRGKDVSEEIQEVFMDARGDIDHMLKGYAEMLKDINDLQEDMERL